MENIRQQFPFFNKNKHTIYFDNASTTQKPKSVITAVETYLQTSSNAGRGSYSIANNVTEDIEIVRGKVANFIHAHTPNEVVFTSGATASLNTIAYSWGLNNLKNNDEILLCLEDHDSNVLPWITMQKTLKKFGIKINIIHFKNTSAGDADLEDIVSKVTKKTRLIALTHIHNVYGTKTDVELLREKVGKDVLISLDASQSVGHVPVNVKDLQVDFLSFSGHKMFALTGIGIVWIDKKHHTSMHPFIVGGQTGNTIPTLLESGTQNIAGIISLGEAVDFINTISIEKIQEHILFLSQYVLSELRKIPHVEFLPGIANCRCAVGYGVLSFTIAGMNSSDIGFILNDKKIYVRTGNHCIGNGNQITESIRVSLHVYNTKEEIDTFIAILKDTVAG